MVSDETKLGEPCLPFFLGSSLRDWFFALDGGQEKKKKKKRGGMAVSQGRLTWIEDFLVENRDVVKAPK